MKLLKVAVAVLVMAAMAVPVIAEDRLSLGGEMRVRGWYQDFDSDGDTDDSTNTWADQRLRIGGKIAVAEGVSITFRTDITESTWGTGNTFGSGRTGLQQWDRAHFDFTKGNFHLRGGQFYTTYGQVTALDDQNNGLSMDYKLGDIPFNAFFMLKDNNGGTGDSDTFLTGAKISPKFGNTAVNFFVGNWNDGSDEDVTLVGADMTMGMDAFTLKAELDFFTGDADATTDAYGTQLFVDGAFALSDTTTIGANLFYALGDETDQQYTGIGSNFGGWDPVNTDPTNLYDESLVWINPFNVASASSFEGMTEVAASAGGIGARLYGNFKLSEDLELGASITYMTEEDDSVVGVEAMNVNGGLVYNIMANTSLHLHVQYVDGTVDPAGASPEVDFDALQAGTGLYVTF